VVFAYTPACKREISRCYAGVPDGLKTKNKVKLPGARVATSKKLDMKYLGIIKKCPKGEIAISRI